MDLPSFSLDQFEGPLDLLIYLIQKQEVNVCDLALKKVAQQFPQEDGIDVCAEVLALAATLLLMKSQKLIPGEEIEMDEAISDRMEMLQQLIEYSRLKEAAKSLSIREEGQKVFFPRQAPPMETSRSLGLEEVSLDDLTARLQEVMARAAKQKKMVEDDQWHVAPKIEWLRELIASGELIAFEEIFSEKRCREELTVIFLALLELMKEGAIQVSKQEDQVVIHGRN